MNYSSSVTLTHTHTHTHSSFSQMAPGRTTGICPPKTPKSAKPASQSSSSALFSRGAQDAKQQTEKKISAQCSSRATTLFELNIFRELSRGGGLLAAATFQSLWRCSCGAYNFAQPSPAAAIHESNLFSVYSLPLESCGFWFCRKEKPPRQPRAA